MTEAVRRLKAEFEALSDPERAELARFLILMLDQEHDVDAEDAWETELNRRAGEIEAGNALGKPAEQVFAEMRKKHC